MKYIIVTNGTESPIMFDESFSHRDMANERTEHVPVSAGYVKITHEGVVCYDESVSLALKPRPQDARIIERALGWKERVVNNEWHPTPPRLPKWDVLGLNTLP